MSGEIELSKLNSSQTAPLQKVEDSATVSIKGTVKKNNEFEWNVGRLYSGRAGSSTFKSWAIAYISTMLVLPAVLTLIVDLGRRIAFSAGLVNGKSYSLIDETSALVSKAVKNVSEFFFPKDTLEKQNIRAEKAMKSAVSTIVGGYRAQNKNSTFKGPLFDEIKKGQKVLSSLVNSYIERNGTKAEDFPVIKQAILEKIAGFFKTDAGSETYVIHKTTHDSATFSISEVAFTEFFNSLDTSVLGPKVIELAKSEYASSVSKELASEEVAAGQAIHSDGSSIGTFPKEKISAEEGFVQTLKVGAETGLINKTQVVETLARIIPEATTDTMVNIGLAKSNEVQKGFADAVVKHNLLTKDQVEELCAGTPPNVTHLAEGAARDIVAINAGETPVVDDQEIVKVTEQLRDQKKLDGDTTAPFRARVEKRVPELREAKAKLEAAAAEKQRRVESLARKAKQEAEATAAELKAKEAAIAQEQKNRFDLLCNFLKAIIVKQIEISPLFENREEQEAKRVEFTGLQSSLQNEKISWKSGDSKKEINILEAASKYFNEVNKIQKLKSSDKDRLAKVEGLKANLGIDQQTVDKIHQLSDITKALLEINKIEGDLSDKIEAAYGAIEGLIKQYNLSLGLGSKTGLDQKALDTLSNLEKKVFENRKNHEGSFARLKISKPSTQVSRDPRVLFSEMKDVADKVQAQKNKEETEEKVPLVSDASSETNAASLVTEPDLAKTEEANYPTEPGLLKRALWGVGTALNGLTYPVRAGYQMAFGNTSKTAKA